MKKQLLIFCLTISLYGYSQNGFNYCQQYNNLNALLGDTIYIDVDNNGSDDIQIYVFFDSLYRENSAVIRSLQTNASNFSDLKLDDASTLGGRNYGFINKKYYGENLNDGNTDVDFDYFSYIAYADGNPNQMRGDTGIVCYRYNRGRTNWCYGWLKIYTSQAIDLVKVISSCGCSKDEMYAGKALAFTSSISKTKNNAPYIIYNDGYVKIVNPKHSPIQMLIIDAAGRCVVNQNVSSNETNMLDIQNLTHGIYLIYTIDNQGYKTITRIIKS